MRRRELLYSTLGIAGLGACGVAAASTGQEPKEGPVAALKRPEKGPVKVAFLVSDHATVIDFCGPWEVFQDAAADDAFELYTVAATEKPVRATAGLQIVPDYSVDKAPLPHVLVVPAMKGSDATLAWIRKVSQSNHLTMSVCTGAFQLARAGLLNGLTATTHHDFLNELESDFPAVTVLRGVRFVEHERIATAAGLTSGMDLALRVVERYFGREVAQQTATYMEHDSVRWKVADRVKRARLIASL